MFPNIDGENDAPDALFKRGVLILRRDRLEFAPLVDDQPSPAGAEARNARGVDLVHHIGDASKSRVDRRSQIPRRLLGAAGRHDVPIKRMVPMAAEIVAHAGAHGFLNFVEFREDRDGGFFRKIGIFFDENIQSGDGRSVMAIMMQMQGLRVDMRLQRLEWVAKIGQFEDGLRFGVSVPDDEALPAERRKEAKGQGRL